MIEEIPHCALMRRSGGCHLSHLEVAHGDPPPATQCWLLGWWGGLRPPPLPPAPFPRTSPTHRDVGGKGGVRSPPKNYKCKRGVYICNQNVYRCEYAILVGVSWGAVAEPPLSIMGVFPPPSGSF